MSSPVLLEEWLQLETLDEQTARVVFPTQWTQGRGMYGGLVTAAMVKWVESMTPSRPLRSLTAELCGPLQPGEATLKLRVLRAGNAVTTTAVEVVQNGEVQAHGVSVLGRARVNVQNRLQLSAPAMRPWKSVDVLPVEPPFGPEFAQFFEFRSTGPIPFTQSPQLEGEGWIQPKQLWAVKDAAFLAACVDAWWPSFYAAEEMPRPMATIAFTFQPLGLFEGLHSDAPLYFRSRLVAAVEGYAVEFRELWAEDGRLLALNQQTIVVIK